MTPASCEAPSVSVVVPAYNAAQTLVACLHSLQRLQPAALEIIVVDDGSTDDTASLAESVGAQVLRLSENCGPGVARNAGARMAKGAYLAFTDADCIARPDWLAAHLAAAAEAFCASTGPYSGSAVDSLVPQLMDLALRFSQLEMPETLESSISSNLFVRRTDFLTVGGFPEYRLPRARKAYWGNEDQELAHLLVLQTGKPVRWVRDGGPLHAYRSTWRGYLAQQARYAEAVLVSHARFPRMARRRANYSKVSGAVRILSAWAALPAFGSFAFSPLMLFAIPFVGVHAPIVRFIVRSEPRPIRRAALAAISPLFLFGTAAAWTFGFASGAVNAAAGLFVWERAEPTQ